MKRHIYLLLILILSTMPSMAHAIVRLKNVSQSGAGSSGTIRIEFNGNYDRSKVKINYEPDHISFLMSDAFVMPVKKVFKSSSSKSSVARMEATMAPSAKRSGGTVRLNVYFRVPIETIKKTGSLSGSANVVNFNYKTLGDAAAADNKALGDTETASVADVAMPESGLQDNGDGNIKDSDAVEAKTREIEAKLSGSEDEVSEDSPGLWARIMSLRDMAIKALKVVGVLLGVVVLLFLALFFFKKRSEQKRYSAPASDLGVFSQGGSGIKVISSFNLEDDKKLYIIEIAGERMLIGTSKHSVSMITKLSASEQPEEINKEHEAIMRSRLKDKLRNL